MSGQQTKKTLFQTTSNTGTASTATTDYEDVDLNVYDEGLEEDVGGVDLVTAAAEAAAQELLAAELAAAATVESKIPEVPSEKNESVVEREEIASVPPTIVEYLQLFQQAVQQNRTPDILKLYDDIFRKHSEKYFPAAAWPAASTVTQFLNANDELFLCLYAELSFRHVFSHLPVTFEDRESSWKNYIKLFSFFLVEEVGAVIDLPVQWLWDMVDEFLYQFQEICEHRNSLLEKGDEEQLKQYRDRPDLWEAKKVADILQELINQSRLAPTEERECLIRLSKSKPSKAQEEAVVKLAAIEAAGEELPSPTTSGLLKKVSFFAQVGLLRFHTLLGDYTAGITAVNYINLFRNAASQVIGCHFNLHYYLGFAYMMSKRYVDAIRVFVSFISFINHTRLIHYKHEKIVKRADKFYGLLAICMTINPVKTNDVIILHTMKEKFFDQISRMQKGDENQYKELFNYSAPKLITPSLPEEGQTKQDGNAQIEAFLAEVREQITIINLRSFLKLYSSITISKLVKFFESEADEQTIRTNLASAQRRSKSLVWKDGPLLSSVEEPTTQDFDFTIENDTIFITNRKSSRRVGDYFARNIIKFEEILRFLE